MIGFYDIFPVFFCIEKFVFLLNLCFESFLFLLRNSVVNILSVKCNAILEENGKTKEMWCFMVIAYEI